MALTQVLLCSVLIIAVSGHHEIARHSVFNNIILRILEQAARLTYPITSGINDVIGRLARPDSYPSYPQTNPQSQLPYSGQYGPNDRNILGNLLNILGPLGSDTGNYEDYNPDYDLADDENVYENESGSENPTAVDEQDYEDAFQDYYDIDQRYNDDKKPENLEGTENKELTPEADPEQDKKKSDVKTRSAVVFPLKHSYVNDKTGPNVPIQNQLMYLPQMPTNQGNILVPISNLNGPNSNYLISGVNQPGNVVVPSVLPSMPSLNNGNMLIPANGQLNQLYTILNIPNINPGTNTGSQMYFPVNIYGQGWKPRIQVPGSNAGFYLVPKKVSKTASNDQSLKNSESA